MADRTRRPRRAAAVACLVAAVTALHFASPVGGHWAHAGHVFLRELYFLPIAAGAVWFGLGGALAAASASAVTYAAHLWLQGPQSLSGAVDQAGAVASFFVLAAVAGSLASLERRARQRALRAERRAEREKVGAAVAALSETLAARDLETREHCHRVAALAEGFAAFLGLPPAEARCLYLAGIVHDIGKIGVRDDVLLKPDDLTPEERRKVSEHPSIAEAILAPIGFEKVVSYVVTHHESVDGMGYPRGLKGAEIPLGGRILAVVDTYDALASKRSYREALPLQGVREAMEAAAGRKLDEDLLCSFWKYLATAPPAAATDRP